jgi:quercetin dioxygenase-like cupin family protein
VETLVALYQHIQYSIAGNKPSEKANCGRNPFPALNWQEMSEMKVIEVKNIQSKPNPHGVDARNLSDTECAQVVHITLQPGEFLKKHITPVDVVFYVLEGQGVVEIGEERKEVGEDTLIESPARIPHRWINESNGLVRILVIKTPRPKETTKML